MSNLAAESAVSSYDWLYFNAWEKAVYDLEAVGGSLADCSGKWMVAIGHAITHKHK